MLHKSTIFSSLVVATLIITGCGSSEEAKEDVTKTSVIGKSSLSRATVCIDTNSDMHCNEDEVSTTTNEKGSYKLTYETTPKKGTQLIAEDGFNLITLRGNNGGQVFSGSLDDDASHNINTFTTLIQERLKDKLSYTEAKKEIAERFNLEADFIDQDPLALLEDEETQAYFLTVRAIEDYYNEHHQKNETTVDSDSIQNYAFMIDKNIIEATYDAYPQKSSVKRSSSANENPSISVDEAVEAVNNTDVFAFDLDAYLERLSTLFKEFFTNLLSFFGFDFGDTYAFDENNLDPYVNMLYINDTNISKEIRTEQLWQFVTVMRADDEEQTTKNYNDLEYVFTHTIHSDVQKGVLITYAFIGSEKSTKLMLETFDSHIFYVPLEKIEVAINILFASIHTHKDVDVDFRDYRHEQAYLYENYFRDSKNMEIKDIIGNAIYNMSQSEGVDMVLDFVNTYYIATEVEYGLLDELPDYYSPENKAAQRMSVSFNHYTSEAATASLVAFYERAQEGKLKQKLRVAYAKLANAATVEKLYELASKVPTLMLPWNTVQQDSAEYIALFITVSHANNDIGTYIIDILSAKYNFWNIELKTSIDNLFTTVPVVKD